MRRLICGVSLIVPPVKRKHSPYCCVISGQTCADLFSGQDIFRPLAQRARSPAAGYLFGRTCADLSAAPGCLVSPKKRTFSYCRIYICSNARQVIQLLRHPPRPGKTRKFPSRWEFNCSNMHRFIRGARLPGFACKKCTFSH